MRLKELRLKNNFLQKELAQMVGVDRTTFSKYETGATEPNYETLLKLADIFNVSTDYLLERDEKKEPTPVFESGVSENAQIFMPLVDELTPSQQQLLLAQLQAWSEQNKRPSPAAQHQGGGTTPKSDF